MTRKTSIVRVTDLFKLEMIGYSQDLTKEYGVQISMTEASGKLAEVIREMRANMRKANQINYKINKKIRV